MSHGLLGDVRKETVVAEVLSGEPQPAERWRPLGEAGAARGCPLACHGGPQVTRSSSSLPFPPVRAQRDEDHGGGQPSLTPPRQRGLTGQEETEHPEKLFFSG